MDRMQIVPGINGMPKVRLENPDGAQAEIYLHGAHLTSWIPVGGDEKIFLSRSATFDGKTPIRGGIPVIFPQFSGFGPLINHGFARILPWELTSSCSDVRNSTARFSLSDSPATLEFWPHSFLLELGISIGGDSLLIELHVENTGEQTFSFTAALHTYLRVQQVELVCIDGLQGVEYLDQTAAGKQGRQSEMLLSITEEVNRVYYNPKPRITLSEGDHQCQIYSKGFGDAVIWNPGAGRGAKIVDLEQEGYRSMVCIEAAVIRHPVRLSPGESWLGSQRLSCKAKT